MPGETKYKSDRAWADGWKSQIREILTKYCAFVFLEFLEAGERDDRQRATDYLVQVRGGQIAVRVRDCTKRDFRDLTLRCRRRSGAETELSKIRSGFARWYLYCWAEDHSILEFILVDLDLLRASGQLDQPLWPVGGRPAPAGWLRQFTADCFETLFVAIPVDELRKLGCVKVDRCSSPSPLPRATR